MRRVVLVTRPEPGLGETMRAVEALGFEPLAAPLLCIEPLAPTIPRRVQAVLLTSGQAVAPLEAQAPWLLDVPVLVVGNATAARARSHGFARVESADGDATRLLRLAQNSLDPADGPLLLACGAGQGVDSVRKLRGAGFAVVRRCLYRAKPATCLDADTLWAIEYDTVLAALFFSGETARAFTRLLPRRLHATLGGVEALAIGSSAADHLSRLSWKRILVSPRPTAASLLSLLRHNKQ